MKRTKWFKGNELPFHVGYYERRWVTGYIYKSYFNGMRWLRSHDLQPTEFQNIPWRGLKDKP